MKKMYKIFFVILIFSQLLYAQHEDYLISFYFNISADYINLRPELTSIKDYVSLREVNTSKSFDPNYSVEFGFGLGYRALTFDLEYVYLFSEYSETEPFWETLTKYEFEGFMIKPRANVLFKLSSVLIASIGVGLSIAQFEFNETLSNVSGRHNFSTSSDNPSFIYFFVSAGFELNIIKHLSVYSNCEYYFDNTVEILRRTNNYEIVNFHKALMSFDLSDFRAKVGARIYFVSNSFLAPNECTNNSSFNDWDNIKVPN